MAVLNNNKSQKGLSSAGLGFGCCLCSAAYLARQQKQASWETGRAKHRGDKQSVGANNKGINKRQGGQTQRGRWRIGRKPGMQLWVRFHTEAAMCVRERQRSQSQRLKIWKIRENTVIHKKALLGNKKWDGTPSRTAFRLSRVKSISTDSIFSKSKKNTAQPRSWIKRLPVILNLIRVDVNKRRSGSKGCL